MKWAKLDDKERIRLILHGVLGYFILEQTAKGYETPQFPKGVNAPAGFHWPIAFWNTDGECWMIRDIATDPTVFDPLHDLNDAWLILDHLKPGRAGLNPQEDQGAFLTLATFISLLENRMERWWAWPKERFCTELCMAALMAVDVEIEG